jgi:hypothetical protein
MCAVKERVVWELQMKPRGKSRAEWGGGWERLDSMESGKNEDLTATGERGSEGVRLEEDVRSGLSCTSDEAECLGLDSVEDLEL